MVHLDGVEGTELDAERAAHAYGSVDIELGRPCDRLALVVRITHDPDALGWAYLGTDAAGRAAIFVFLSVPQQHWDVAEALGQQALLFRILNRQQAFLRDRLFDH